MKIPGSIRALYKSNLEEYQKLKAVVDALFSAKKRERWHYESRIKAAQSFALKVESGRGFRGDTLEDLFACTLVVENSTALEEAELLVRENFVIEDRRPPSTTDTRVHPETFRFEDIRLYARSVTLDDLRPRGFENCVFEIQLKTFLQHAWTIATHDLVYKSGDRRWGRSRIAFQVKAMLEQAETAIGAAAVEEVVALVDRPYRPYKEVSSVVAALEARWPGESLPEDRATLADNLIQLMRALKMEMADFFQLLDDATGDGRGAKTTNLSPFTACVQSIVDKRREELLAYLRGHRQPRDFVVVLPSELELPLEWRDRQLPRARQLS